MRAELAPLKGKYYGTQVTVYSDDGNSEWIMVWCNIGPDGNVPSDRELEGWNVEQDGEYEICDNHYESKFAYEVAQRIVKGINEE